MDTTELIGEVLGKGELTIREWRAKFIDNHGVSSKEVSKAGTTIAK